MAQFVNAKDDMVKEAIDGLLACSGGALARLDGYPHIKVVHRTDWDRSKVALISGGGSGHEPAHAGFVGPGMLTAAVCGEVFASPSVEAVLAGILAVTGDAGCLLIVKNYTGDRLNFGLAAERARSLGHQVEMVVVDDDVALPDLPQPRGVAGTLFVHKITGAMAEAGASLADITAAAKRIIANVASIGKSLDTCTIPGSPKEDRIPTGKAELGLGIHGEPGVEQVDFAGAADAMQIILDKLVPHMKDGPCVALMNNLGSTTPLEMSVLCHALSEAGVATHMIGPAPMMTSLDMHGFSVSVLPASAEDLAALAAPVPMPAWPGLAEIGPVAVAPIPDGLLPTAPIPSASPKTRAVIEAVADLLIGAEATLNTLDAKSGDGDTGSTLATAARALKGNLDKMPLADLTQFFPALGNELSQTMGGSSGVILAIYFNAAGDACARGASVQKALKEGLKRVSEVGGAQIGDRTMVDALAPALDAMSGGLAAAAAAARTGADSTASIHKAKAGRAAYVPSENLIGNNDPGAEAVALLFEGLIKALESAN
ncbi:dihydroxyacetone kinase subunit DhaK [Ruegeria arenilitoris]|uniref:dihydroxyacetone kinase subunit DhaK n=1 Tax=Ruegeria arenilitoris TaxID=1173585 RepID=UPI00147EF9EC|nr:dihydroxyacetone kinase subunit DhaK [Ruegeria arenilitoris]